jgi:hypothetical protein
MYFLRSIECISIHSHFFWPEIEPNESIYIPEIHPRFVETWSRGNIGCPESYIAQLVVAKTAV